MFVEDLNADFNAADLDDKESNGDEIFMLLPLIFGAFGKIPSTILLIYQKIFKCKYDMNLLINIMIRSLDVEVIYHLTTDDSVFRRIFDVYFIVDIISCASYRSIFCGAHKISHFHLFDCLNVLIVGEMNEIEENRNVCYSMAEQ